jgi:hypothetical protein
MPELSRLKWIIVAALACISGAAWLGIALGILWIKFALPIWTGIAVTAAVSTEALMWSVAAALGLSAIEARHRVVATVRAWWQRNC